jgi:hypothetical protein
MKSPNGANTALIVGPTEIAMPTIASSHMMLTNEKKPSTRVDSETCDSTRRISSNTTASCSTVTAAFPTSAAARASSGCRNVSPATEEAAEVPVTIFW